MWRQNSSFLTLVHIAAYKANIGAMKFLIGKGMNVNVVNQEGKTPLQILVEEIAHNSGYKLQTYQYLLSCITFIRHC